MKLCRCGHAKAVLHSALCAYCKAVYSDGVRASLRSAVMILLGGVCYVPGCGITSMRMLDIHHVEGGGDAHRVSSSGYRGTNTSVYRSMLRDIRDGHGDRYVLACPNHHRMADLDLGGISE